MIALRLPTIPVSLVVLLACCALAIPSASADRTTGAQMMKDAGRALIRYKIEPETLGALGTDDGRATLVEHIHRYCQGLEQVVPRNSPAEQEWLMNESRSSSPERMTRARFSSEWARWRMALLIDDCFLWVEVYQEADRETGRYVVGKPGALIELGRAFGGHLESAQEWVDTLAIDDLTLHTLATREIMDLSLFAAHWSLPE